MTPKVINRLQRRSILFVLLINTLLFTNAYAIKPQREYTAKPDVIGITYQEYKIKVNDSIALNSWACLQDDLKKPFIIISGGDAGNMANSLGQAKALYESGYNVILYDYRGFGESSDFKINPAMMYYNEFAEDLLKTIDFVKAKFKPNSIVLYGLSMGTIVSRINIDHDKAIKGLILDSFVIDPKLVVDRIAALKKNEVLLPEKATAYSESNKTDLKKPVLIFSGLKDLVTKTEDYKGFILKNHGAKMITWDCGHLQCFTSMEEDSVRGLYTLEVHKFVSKL